MNVCRTHAILAGLLLTASTAYADDPVYALTPVHFPVQGVRGINAQGDIIGSHLPSDILYAYVANDDYFAPFGRWFGLSNSSALAINDNLEVVGDFSGFGGARFSFHYDVLTQMLTVLPGLGGGHNNTGGLNNRGQVVGSSATLRGETHAFLWDGVDILDINPFDAAYSTAADINDAGVVLGQFGEGGADRIFLYVDGVPTDLGSPGGRPSARAINIWGEFVGSTFENSVTRPFIYSNGEFTVLPIEGFASDINDHGDVIINGNKGDAGVFIYRDGELRQIDPPEGWQPGVFGINNNGIIGGYGRAPGESEFTAFKFTLLGDMNWDDRVNAFDIEPFLMALFEPEQYRQVYGHDPAEHGDMDGRGGVNSFDIEPFLELLFP